MIEYKIYKEVYDEILSGRKTIEFRLLNDKSDKIKIGDIINFSVLNDEMLNLKVIVIDKIVFDDLDELWNNKEYLESNISFANKEGFVNAFYNIFGEEKVIASKIVGIKFNVID